MDLFSHRTASFLHDEIPGKLSEEKAKEKKKKKKEIWRDFILSCCRRDGMG